MANNISIHMIIIFNNWEESWKYEAQQSIFDELRGVSSGDETLCRMLDITSQTMILEGEIKALFHLISKYH